MKKIVVLVLSLVVLTACVTNGSSVPLTINSDHQINTLVYEEPKGQLKDVAFVYLHGKWGSPNLPHNVAVASSLNKQGYRVVAPTMHWKKDDYSLPYMAVSDITKSAIKKASAGGKKVVVIGHSLGGSSVFYIGKQDLPEEVIGLVALAPGHLPHQSGKMQAGSHEAVEKARVLVSQGKGGKRGNYPDFNMGRWEHISMPAKVYLSYYDLDVHPDDFSSFNGIKRPVLVINGQQDKLTNFTRQYVTSIEDAVEKSSYLEIKGGHKSVNSNVAPHILDWIATL